MELLRTVQFPFRVTGFSSLKSPAGRNLSEAEQISVCVVWPQEFIVSIIVMTEVITKTVFLLHVYCTHDVIILQSIRGKSYKSYLIYNLLKGFIWYQSTV